MIPISGSALYKKIAPDLLRVARRGRDGADVTGTAPGDPFYVQSGRNDRLYRDVVGLAVVGTEDGWVDFGAGGCGLALHAGKAVVGSRPPKIVFYAADVAQARAALVKRGLGKAGAVKSASRFDMCDCEDPDGNPFQISSRA